MTQPKTKPDYGYACDEERHEKTVYHVEVNPRYSAHWYRESYDSLGREVGELEELTDAVALAKRLCDSHVGNRYRVVETVTVRRNVARVL